MPRLRPPRRQSRPLCDCLCLSLYPPCPGWTASSHPRRRRNRTNRRLQRYPKLLRRVRRGQQSGSRSLCLPLCPLFVCLSGRLSVRPLLKREKGRRKTWQRGRSRPTPRRCPRTQPFCLVPLRFHADCSAHAVDAHVAAASAGAQLRAAAGADQQYPSSPPLAAAECASPRSWRPGACLRPPACGAA